MLPGFRSHKVEGNQRGVRHWIIQVPHDLGDSIGVFLGGDNLDDVFHSDGCCGFRRHINFGVALALKTGGEGEKIRVVTLRQRRNSR